MVSQPPKHSRTGVGKSRAQVVKPGRLPVTEFAFDRAGAASPFGDDVTFPLPVDALAYEHPVSEGVRADHEVEPE
jgi:succinate dehydrogenase / fumarate reductase iron-sulfur subunit